MIKSVNLIVRCIINCNRVYFSFLSCIVVFNKVTSSVQLLQYLSFTQSYKYKYYDGCADEQLHRNISVFSRLENCPSVSDVVLISGGRLFHADGPATEKLRGPKPAVLVWGTTRSP